MPCEGCEGASQVTQDEAERHEHGVGAHNDVQEEEKPGVVAGGSGGGEAKY